ncbi:MFS transporter [Cumulibacter soli]|uniref:MFS transporter n=1 Tax=Cumulibacter soli TaxID=2546344 RepID=UPI0010676232|nr:MFS transporter [Cumulibacter soli]
MTTSEAPAIGAGPMRRALVVLCITEIVAWGVLYYAMPVAAEPMANDTGWSQSSIFGTYSAGLVVSAFVGIPLGWLLERRGPRLLMTGASILVVPCLIIVATATSITQLAIGWILAGLVMPALFYQAAFTACTGWMGENRVKGITAVTVAGGISSTVFAPLTSWLLSEFHWRTMWLILAGVLVLILVPLQWFCLNLPWTPVAKADAAAMPVGRIVRTPRYIALSASITVFIFGGFAVCLTIVSLMTERGFSHSFGATALALIGVGQLVGRLGFGRFGHGRARMVRNMVIVWTLVLSTVLVAVVERPVWVLIVIVVLLGAARGAGTLMHATMVVDIWGPERYGALIGIFTMPITLAQAIAPWAGAAMAAQLGSFRAMDLVIAGLIAVSAVGIYFSSRVPAPVAEVAR